MNEVKRKAKLCRIVSVPLAFVHIVDCLKTIKESGKFEIDLVSSRGKLPDGLESFNHIPLEIKREISLFSDLKSFVKLFFLFKRMNYDIVHSTTPKAGLIVSLAAFLAAVPVRLHTFTGQRWVTCTGLTRFILRLSDKIICLLSTKVYADSRSQADFLIQENIVKREKIDVIHLGSLGGVNPEKFSREKCVKEIPSDLNIDQKSFKLAFLGRVTKDKGVEELVEAFLEVKKQGHLIELILIGPFEEELDPLSKKIISEIKNNSNIHAVGEKSRPQDYLQWGHLFVLPSYREGFGTVILEAASMHIPSIGTDIVGLVDSIQEGHSGLLVKQRDVESLKTAIWELMNNPTRLKKMGDYAYRRVCTDFHYQVLAKKQIEEYFKFFDRS